MHRDSLDGIVNYLAAEGLKVVTAESCTAGLIASTLAEPPGCGTWLEAAFVTYSETAKIECLEVDEEVIASCGLTSEAVARAMAEGALRLAQGNLGIATTGVAGPSTGDGSEPVGTVCIAWAFLQSEKMHAYTEKLRFDGSRNEIREAAMIYALENIERHHHHMLTASKHAHLD